MEIEKELLQQIKEMSQLIVLSIIQGTYRKLENKKRKKF